MIATPYGWICERLFLSQEERRHRRRFRTDFKQYHSQLKVATSDWFDQPCRRDILDPSDSAVDSFARWFSAIHLPEDPNWLALNRRKFTWALRPRLWEFRRLWRRWRKRPRFKLA